MTCPCLDANLAFYTSRTNELGMEKVKAGAYHYFKENREDWNNAFEGQWFMGVYDYVNKVVVLWPSEIQWKPEIAMNTDNRSINRYASGAKEKPKSWSTVKADGDTPGDLAWHKKQENEAHGTLHGKICSAHNLAQKNCVGFVLIKLSRDGQFAQFKGSSKSLNTDWATPAKMPDVGEQLKVRPYSFAIRTTDVKRPERAVHAGTMQVPEAARNELLKFFKEEWGVPNIASSYE